MKLRYLTIMFFLLVAGCTTTGNTVNEVSSSANIREATLAIDGMYCSSCALGIEYQLKQVDGVIDADVDLAEGRGIVRFDADKVTAAVIAEASDVYPARVIAEKELS